MKTKTVLISLVSVMLVAAMTALPVAAEETFSCGGVIGLGIPGVLGVSFGDGLGGCNVVTTEEESTVVDWGASAGCRVAADQTGDGFGDPFEEGSEFPEGTSVFVVCDIGTLDGGGFIVLDF